MEASQDDNAAGDQVKPEFAIELIANRWRLTILHALSPGLLRYGELQRAVGKVSHKRLTEALRGLERDGLVERRMHKSVPPRVEYLLTPLGQSLLEPLGMLCRWAEQHRAEITTAQSSFDERERSWAVPAVPVGPQNLSGRSL